MSEQATSSTQDSEDADAWRERLLASLKDCGVQRAPRHPILNSLLAAFVMLLTIVIGRLLVAGLDDLARGPEGPMALLIGYPLLFIFGVAVLSRVRNLFLRRAWQSSARSAEKEISKIGSRRPILYLRSFALDKHLERKSWLERFLGTIPFANAEQAVTSILRRIGPVIAIGRPSEKLPALGAARFYVSHDRWQEKVADVLKESQMVLWATGVTEGLRWEISHLIENLTPQRLILWAHPNLIHGSRKKREEEWRQFRDTLGGVFPKPLPEKLGDARFFIFDNQWNPTPIAPNYWNLLQSRQISAIQKALKAMQLSNAGTFRLGSEHSKAWLLFWNLARVMIGLVLVFSIFGLATPKFCRLSGLGSLNTFNFLLVSAGLGLGVSMLAAGLAAFFRRPLKWTWTLAIIPIVSILYGLAIPTIGAPLYWRAEEKAVWSEAQTNPSQVQFYSYIPPRYKRREAYAFLTNWLEKRAAKPPSEIDWWIKDDIEHVLKEIDAAHPNDAEIQALKPRLQALLDK